MKLLKLIGRIIACFLLVYILDFLGIIPLGIGVLLVIFGFVTEFIWWIIKSFYKIGTGKDLTEQIENKIDEVAKIVENKIDEMDEKIKDDEEGN